MSEHISKTDRKTAPTTEQWQRLYDIASLLKTMAPWRMLWDMDIITIQLPDRKEPVFCSVLGQGGTCFGVGVYPDCDSLSRMLRMIADDQHDPNGMDAFEQRYLACYFGDREEIEPQDREVIKALGLRFRGRNQWIYFRAMEPGCAPWFLDAEQAALMTDVLGNLAMACDYLMQGKIQVNFEGGETFLRFFSEERQEWLNTAVPMPNLPNPQYSIHISDELFVARLKKQKKLNVRLELDSFYIPTPIQEKRTDIPRLPLVIALGDRDDGMILGQHIAQPDESREELLLTMLVNFIEEHGRPAALFVRDDRVGNLLAGICKEIGVPLKFGKGMPVIDEMFESLTDFLS